VDQQALLPTPKDPSVWAVHVRGGKEQELCVQMARKAVAMARQGSPLAVKSVYCKPETKGYVYVEAFREAHARAALQGNHHVIHSRPYKLVPRGEMVLTLATSARAADQLRPRSWVRVRSGPYKGDLGRVLDLDAARGRATVTLVPRLDYAHISRRQARAAGEEVEADPGARRQRPAARPFNAEEAREHGMQDVEERHNEEGGLDLFIHVGSTPYARLRGGYLLKEFSLKMVRLEKNPLLDEIQRFHQSGGGADGEGTDLAAIAAELPDIDDASAGVVFRPGDKVRVTKGEQANLTGRVSAIEGTEARVRITTEGTEGLFKADPTFKLTELAKYFEVGDHVCVDLGDAQGTTGTVVKVEGAVVTLTSDATQTDVQAFARNLSATAAQGGGTISVLGQYKLGDLVELDDETYGVVVLVERMVAHVLTNHGTLTQPDIRLVTETGIKRRLVTGRNQAQDALGRGVKARDLVG